MRYRLDYAKRKQCEMLHKALLIGDYTAKDWCADMGIPAPKMYGLYTMWREETGTAKVPRIRRTA